MTVALRLEWGYNGFTMDSTLGRGEERGPRALEVELPASLAEALAAEEFRPLARRLLKSEILRAQLLRSALRGLTAKQSSEALGCSYWMARQCYAEPHFRRTVLSKVEGALAYADELYNKQTKSLHERIAEKSEKAFEVLCDLLENPSTHPSIRMRIGQDLMDRTPDLSKSTTVEHKHAFSAEQLVLAARTAEEMHKPNVISIRKIA